MGLTSTRQAAKGQIKYLEDFYAVKKLSIIPISITEIESKNVGNPKSRRIVTKGKKPLKREPKIHLVKNGTWHGHQATFCGRYVGIHIATGDATYHQVEATCKACLKYYWGNVQRRKKKGKYEDDNGTP